MAAAQVDNRPSNSRADDTPSNTATQQSSSSQIADGPNAPAQNKDRRRRGRGPQNDGAAPAVTRSDQPSGRGRGGQRGGGRGRQQQSNNNNGGESSNQNNGGNSRGNGGRSRGGRGRGRDQANTGSSAPAAGSGSGQPQAQSEADIPAVSARKRNFGGRITTGDDAISSNTTAHGKGKAVAHAAPPPPPQIREYADLRSRLVAELGSGQHECSICYSTLTTRQPCWSCDQCYTVLHLNCTKKWASTSVEQANAQLAMQEDPEMRARRGTWRCPGCQFAREDVPQGYWCWCGRIQDPQPKGGLTPHSCGQRCGKGSCPHGGCAEPCHPGPCAPCAVTVSKRCHCGKHVLPMRCSQINPSGRNTEAALQPGVHSIASEAPAVLKADRGISCNEPCGKSLNCGSHVCAEPCHAGPCKPCTEQITAKCYCGLEEKDLVCGSEGTAQRCVAEDGKAEWTGLWACETVQKKPYECGKHFYDQLCSVQSHATSRPTCPRSPSLVKTCPCGKEKLENRTSCEDDIPTCGNKCEKVLPCGHQDTDSKCHHGACPPCRVQMTTPCRCGESRETRQCYEHQREQNEGGQEILCSNLCKALRNCGKHVCNRRCCPLSFQAKTKGKKRPTAQELAAQDPAGFHECNVPCGKSLPCGSHSCPMTCHRGPCQRCLQASFEELICFCGRTVLEPPVACGTVIRCNFPCTRPPPACGHAKTQHNCHEEEACPPCVFLTERLCHCGKAVVQAVPCSRSTDRVRCGMTCGALMPCGYHRCEGHCHAAGDCGTCTQVCAKPRKLCGHPCTKPCHAPASCPDSEPCESIITIQCPCGHLQQKSKCGASTSNPAGRERALKCNDACAIAQRNMKLADALGLNYAEKSAPAAYEVDTLKFYASHKAFGDDVERALNEFINSSRNGMILPPAKKEHRKFTHELAAVYKLATESVDAEPKRSVSVRRLQGSRIPAPLLSEAWANAVALHGSASVASTKLSTAPIDRNKAAHPAGSSSSGGGASSALPVPANQPLNAIVLENVFGHSASSLRETLQQSLPTNVMPAFSMRWVTDENVLLTFDQGVPPTLVRIRSLIRDLLSRTGLATQALLCVVNKEGTVLRTEEDGGAVTAVASGHHSGTATPRLAVGGLDSSLGRTTSSAGAAGAGPSGTSAGAAPKKLGGWAAIASGAATTQSSRLNQASTSVWDSGAARRAPGSGATAGPSSAATRANGPSALGPATTSRLVLGSASSSARSSPRINSEATLGFSREVTPDDWETS